MACVGGCRRWSGRGVAAKLSPFAQWFSRSIQAWRLGAGGSRLQLLHAARAVVDEESCRSFSLAPRPGWGFAQRQTLGQERSVGAVEKTAKRGASPLPALGLVEWHRSGTAGADFALSPAPGGLSHPFPHLGHNAGRCATLSGRATGSTLRKTLAD